MCFSETNIKLISLSLSFLHGEKGLRATAPTYGRLFGEGKVSRPARRDANYETSPLRNSNRISLAREQRSCTCVYRLQRGRLSGLEGREFLLPATSATHVHLYREEPRTSIPVRARAFSFPATDGPAHQGGNNVRGPRGPREKERERTMGSNFLLGDATFAMRHDCIFLLKSEITNFLMQS